MGGPRLFLVAFAVISRRPIRKPAPLKKGDTIAVLAPSSPVDGNRLRQGIRELEAIGYTVVCEPPVLAQDGFFAGPHEQRTQSLLKHLQDPNIKAVFCARGGYGSNYIVERLAERAMLHQLRRLPPKIVMGYSDVTSLLTFLNQALGWVVFQGPMLTKDFAEGENGYDRAQMHELLSVPFRNCVLETTAFTLREGVAEGRLVGGCLSLVAATLGTPQEIDTRNAILLLEDVDEKPYRIDRMLFHLRRAGKFKNIRGAIFGEMPGCGVAGTPLESLREVILSAFAQPPVPVIFGLRFGHTTRRCLTLPIGIRARLSAGPQVSLTLLESAVRAVPRRRRRRRSG